MLSATYPKGGVYFEKYYWELFRFKAGLGVEKIRNSKGKF